MAKYTIPQYESAGRALVKAFGGIKNLAETAAGQKERNESIEKTIGDRLSFEVLVYTDDRRKWLDRHKVPYKNVDKTFNELFGQAGAYLVNKFMMKHGYRIADTGRPVGSPYGLVKIDSTRKPKKASPFGL